MDMLGQMLFKNKYSTAIKVGGVVVGGVVVYFAIIRPIKNIIAPADKQKAKRLYNENLKYAWWSGNYYIGREGQLSFQNIATEGNNIAKSIYKAWGIINDDESAVNNALRNIRTYVDLSYVVYCYGKLYNKSLLDELYYRLSNKEFIDAMSFIKSIKII